ncbi:MAG: substrate-binding domain-containing protein, partial [Candidatus Omnitrophota bacterium]|nr:substrate-binding domain-containing protein [Candidatus Omnitrophota bacterium]
MEKILLSLILITTTSVQDSGLLDKLVPLFEQTHACKVKVVAVGSGAAFRLGKEGNGDLILVHDEKGEEEFVSKGYGVKRFPFMYNEFVICGPGKDPAGVKKAKNVFEAFRKIYEQRARFVSRDDDSGTHRREKRIWQSIGVKPNGIWYLETGNGMIETLRIAEEKNAYVLSDSSTFLFHQKEFENVSLLFRDQKNLRNTYTLIPLSPEKFPGVNSSLSAQFIDFLTKGEGRKVIREYRKNGIHLFKP